MLLNRRFRVCLLLTLLLISLLPAASTRRVTILFFNDLHGHLQPFTVKGEDGARLDVGGAARLAALIKRVRTENEAAGVKTFLLVAGDILQGTPMSTVFGGRADVEVLNALGVDAMTIGNHEFDFGLENFLELQKAARFPFLSSNLRWRDSRRPVGVPAVRLAIGDDMWLHVIGATTRELLTTTSPRNVEKLTALDSVPEVRREYNRRSGAGPVVLLSHSRFQTDAAIARAVSGLSAVIGGHDQILFNPFRRVRRVPIFQAFEKGRYLGRIDLEIPRRGGRATVVNWEYKPVTAEVTPDPEVAAIVARYERELAARFSEVIGESRSFLYGERDKIRFEETNLGNFVTDVMREHTGSDIALLNAGALRASIDQGVVSQESVFKAMPYANELMVVRVTGRVLLQALQRAVKGARDDEDGGFLHVSGLRFVIVGKTVHDVRVGGAKLAMNKVYSVTITDFMADGGDGYTMFKSLKKTDTGLPLRELLVETIRQRKVIDAAVDGRITRR